MTLKVMPWKDIESKRAYEREWRRQKYATDPEYRARKQATDKSWRDRLREELRRYKVEVGCTHCGYNRCSDSLHFHHRDASGKELTIGNAIQKGRERVWDEVAKCDVVCANCHGEIHAGLLS